MSSYSLPHPSWGWQRGFIPDTSVGRAGRGNEAMGWCLLRVVGGLGKGGWMWFSPSCLKDASPSVSQTGIGVYPWKLVCWREKGALPGADKPLAMHGGVQGDPSP